MKSNQVDVLALAVFRDLEHVDHAEEPRLASQRRRDIGKPIGSIESISISPSSMA
jgi:hypothetical protein